MKSKRVKELMVPLSEYATVSKEATLFQAVQALEKAQEEFDQTRYRHRAVLIYDENDAIVGKISQNDILRALEPKYEQLGDPNSLSRFGFPRTFQKTMMEQMQLWDKPLRDICRKAADLQVKSFMYTPQDGEYVPEDATLDEAIHQLVMGRHQSLLVTEGKKGKRIVGILRLTDVFKAVSEVMAECELK